MRLGKYVKVRALADGALGAHRAVSAYPGIYGLVVRGGRWKVLLYVPEEQHAHEKPDWTNVPVEQLEEVSATEFWTEMAKYEVVKITHGKRTWQR